MGSRRGPQQSILVTKVTSGDVGHHAAERSAGRYGDELHRFSGGFGIADLVIPQKGTNLNRSSSSRRSATSRCCRRSPLATHPEVEYTNPF